MRTTGLLVAALLLSACPSSRAGSGGRGEVVIFTRTTGYRHASIEKAAQATSAALSSSGWRVRVTDDPAVFSKDGLAKLKGVVLLSTTGKPLGDQAEAPLKALESWVKGGGALIGIHAASSTQYDPALPYTRLVGGKFINHPGSVRPAACHPSGNHPAVAKLPSPFPVRDEIYRFEQLRADNKVIMTCDALEGGGQLPVAWHRTEGSGRVFYSALGHAAEDFAADAPKFRDHMLPGMLWALGQ